MQSGNQYFRCKVKEFYALNKRDFFWRNNRMTPFHVLVTELFLKRTRAEIVERFIHGFLSKYPDAKTIQFSRHEKILDDIKFLGLGKQRTKALKQIAEYVVNQFNNDVPKYQKKLLEIPHVGLYIANATLCFGYNKRFSIIDVNVARIFSRYFLIRNDLDIRDNHELQKKVGSILPRAKFKEYNWGLLDLGALVCKPVPLCVNCPLEQGCKFLRPKSKYPRKV